MYLGGYALGMEWGGGMGTVAAGGSTYNAFSRSPPAAAALVCLLLSWMWRVGYNCAWQAKESPQHKLGGLLS